MFHQLFPKSSSRKRMRQPFSPQCLNANSSGKYICFFSCICFFYNGWKLYLCKISNVSLMENVTKKENNKNLKFHQDGMSEACWTFIWVSVITRKSHCKYLSRTCTPTSNNHDSRFEMCSREHVCLWGKSRVKDLHLNNKTFTAIVNTETINHFQLITMNSKICSLTAHPIRFVLSVG